MYLDSAYVAKYYVNERDATAVRKLIRLAPHICSSSCALVEVSCALHRLATALEAGETEIWTNDRHMLAAAPYVGLVGKSVGD